MLQGEPDVSTAPFGDAVSKVRREPVLLPMEMT
ncbi:hypothetical protein R77564_03720 [Ralstonia sp. LMG 32965]|uniref:Uncharacterized protein n=1 Tax=Ralstonia flatus TaxID=3058601 RepID=A0ABM9KZH5_9RALS|nr:hypothetical protein R77564_03720 [Ralstonia sp. LMG 32965]